MWGAWKCLTIARAAMNKTVYSDRGQSPIIAWTVALWRDCLRPTCSTRQLLEIFILMHSNQIESNWCYFISCCARLPGRTRIYARTRKTPQTKHKRKQRKWAGVKVFKDKSWYPEKVIKLYKEMTTIIFLRIWGFKVFIGCNINKEGVSHVFRLGKQRWKGHQTFFRKQSEWVYVMETFLNNNNKNYISGGLEAQGWGTKQKHAAGFSNPNEIGVFL